MEGLGRGLAKLRPRAPNSSKDSFKGPVMGSSKNSFKASFMGLGSFMGSFTLRAPLRIP